MKQSERNRVKAIILSTIVIPIVWFVLPIYNISMILIGGWTYLLIIFTWFVGIGFGYNQFNLEKAMENVANKSTDSDNPLDILKKRYAKGEITKKKYEEMKRNLK